MFKALSSQVCWRWLCSLRGPFGLLSTGSTRAWCPRLLSQGQEQVGAQERTGVLLELTPPAVVQRLDIVMSRDWRASGPKCSHPELELGFSSERPQSRISSIHHSHDTLTISAKPSSHLYLIGLIVSLLYLFIFLYFSLKLKESFLFLS